MWNTFFEYDGRGYLFEPEYTDEELLAQDAERMARTEEQQPEAASRLRSTETWRCSCGHCIAMTTEEDSLCCEEWDLVQAGPDGSQGDGHCFA